ncbi:hypothetical protein DFR58_10167 [Anaerobacterium chartisolvens]|uniref:Uncharacterized protein n=1 Tax=Anaerobacterium chartisolvens TaxID=1297424 RepID=A0A369BHX2_9FIRM|nr:hypothetical protein [Anaerobacterium chartisolvens]RCX20865.1 hypothetical protein DFR58_10167 [Anaerobacterium chartisolvens]
MSEYVSKEVCTEKHKSADDKMETAERRLNDHAGRIKTIEQALVLLTKMAEDTKKKDFFDKVLIFCVLVMVIVVGAIVLGPEITGKMLGGI